MEKSKFRAIDQFTDDFIYGQAVILDSDNNQGYVIWGNDRSHCVKFKTKGQYIGINDVDGAEIYVGDITDEMMVSDGNKYIKSKCVIQHIDGQFLAVPLDTKADGYLTINSNVKIIGNIH